MIKDEERRKALLTEKSADKLSIYSRYDHMDLKIKDVAVLFKCIADDGAALGCRERNSCLLHPRSVSI